jgi:hypothetical protein
MEFAKGSTNNAFMKGLEVEDIENCMEMENEAPVVNQLTEKQLKWFWNPIVRIMKNVKMTRITRQIQTGLQ